MNNKAHIKNTKETTYSNVDSNGNIKPVEIARWFQDLFLKQEQILGKEDNENNVWILLNYDMNIYKYPKHGDVVKTETYPYSFNRFYGNRVFFIKDKNDEVMVEAKTRWLYVDKDSFKIKKITKEKAQFFGINEIEKGKGFEVDKIDDTLFNESKPKELNLRINDIDINNHVNNTNYFAFFYDFISKEKLGNYNPYKIQITYKKELTLKDSPKVYVKDTIEDSQLYSYVKIINGKEDCTYIKILWKEKNEY